MTSEATILDRVRRIIIGSLDADPDKVTEGARFIEDLGADSLDWIDLLAEAEAEFDIEITDEEGEAVRTVSDAVALISRKLDQ